MIRYSYGLGWTTMARFDAPTICLTLIRISEIRAGRQRNKTYVQIMQEWSEEHDAERLFIQPGKPTQNDYIESFNFDGGRVLIA